MVWCRRWRWSPSFGRHRACRETRGYVGLAQALVTFANSPDIIQVYRDTVEGPIFFNQNATSTLAAIQRHFPLDSDCADQPGEDLVSEQPLDRVIDLLPQGFRVICDEATCQESS